LVLSIFSDGKAKPLSRHFSVPLIYKKTAYVRARDKGSGVH